ncbi:MAG: HAD family hydrolase [Candidatus Krumholzibacteria bacterium]|nr:HAD family hydrolase [Candidatus Krumholzibacteria bacterium]
MLRDRTHWIFDLDGTLTVAAHDFDAIRRELALEPRIPILEQLARLAPDDAEPKRARLEEIELEVALRAEPQPGAHELLDALHARGAVLGILTRNRKATALRTLDACALTAYFDAGYILGREACPPKPSADGIRALLAAWKVLPERAVMVGDFLFDMVAGREAGVTTVLLDVTGRGEWAPRAEVAVGSLAELTALLR